MLQRTHLLISIFLILLLIPFIEDKFIFIVLTIFATYIPDIDARYSKLGRKTLSRILQFFTKHRGGIHSFTFLFIITLLFALFLPIVALGFFVGYGSHLIADSFTLEGIQPFYPMKKRISGKIRTGGKTEILVLITFIFVDLIFFVFRIKSIF